jgi:hypothetical protein
LPHQNSVKKNIFGSFILFAFDGRYKNIQRQNTDYMKKLILFTLFSSTLFAQTQKGSFTVGTQLSQNNLSFDENFKSRSHNISPNVGYFLIDNLNIGLQSNLGFGKIKNSFSTGFNNNTYLFTSYNLGPYFTYYIGKNKLKPFVGASAGFGGSKIQVNNSTDDEATQSFYNFYGGLTYFINSNIGLNSALTYNSSKYDKVNTIQVLRLSFGLQLFFPKK